MPPVISIVGKFESGKTMVIEKLVGMVSSLKGVGKIRNLEIFLRID